MILTAERASQLRHGGFLIAGSPTIDYIVYYNGNSGYMDFSPAIDAQRCASYCSYHTPTYHVRRAHHVQTLLVPVRTNEALAVWRSLTSSNALTVDPSIFAWY